MKKIFIAIIFLCLIAPKVSAKTIYKPRSGLYSFLIPAGWGVDMENQSSAEVYLAPLGKHYKRARIFALKQKTQGSLEHEIVGKKQVQIFKRKTIKIHGSKCLQLSYEFNRNQRYIITTACHFKFRYKKRDVKFTFYLTHMSARNFTSRMEPAYHKVVRSLKFPSFVKPAR